MPVLNSCVSTGPSKLFIKDEQDPELMSMPEGKIELTPVALGFWGMYEDWRRPGSFRVRTPEMIIGGYQRLMGIKPAIWTGFIWRRDGLIEYRKPYFDQTAERDVIPFEFLSLNSMKHKVGHLSDLVDNKEFIGIVETYAKDVEQNKIRFLCCTMRELNGRWFWWGQQPKTSEKIFNQIHQIFADNGADPYVTWVQEVYVEDSHYGMSFHDPMRYIWNPEKFQYLAFSCYSRKGNRNSNMTFYNQAYGFYKRVQKNFGNIRMMVGEIGKTEGKSQPEYYRKAFELLPYMKQIRGFCIFNSSDLKEKDNSSLTKESREVIVEYYNKGFLKGPQS